MEYADDGDLFQKITEQKKKRMYFEEKKVWKIAIQVAYFNLSDVVRT